MVFTSTILAVVLGLAPVREGEVMEIDGTAYAQKIGRYVETTDHRGVRHLRGNDSRGRHYEATIDNNGRVEAYIGERLVEFTVAEAR